MRRALQTGRSGDDAGIAGGEGGNMKTLQRALERELGHNGGSIGGGESPIDDHTSGAIRDGPKGKRKQTQESVGTSATGSSSAVVGEGEIPLIGSSWRVGLTR
jgi:hypothetical protein